jgi:TonB family protein
LFLSIKYALALIALIGIAASPSLATTVNLSEASLRRIAKTSEMPRFPRESRKRGSNGVAVVRIEINEAGDVVNATALQAPDEDISRAVVEAVNKWKFDPTRLKTGESARVKGKLTFYFILRPGNPRVESPKF